MACFMKSTLLLSLGLFVAACCLPALEFRRGASGTDVMWGLSILVVAWSGIFAGVVAWYANPFWVAGLLFGLFGKRPAAVVLGAVAIWIGMSTFSEIGHELPADESNVNHMTLVRLLPGCYVWMLSFVLLPLAALSPGRSWRNRLP